MQNFNWKVIFFGKTSNVDFHRVFLSLFHILITKMKGDTSMFFSLLCCSQLYVANVTLRI